MAFTTIELSRRGSIALLGLDRPDKLNDSKSVAVDALILLEPQPGRC